MRCVSNLGQEYNKAVQPDETQECVMVWRSAANSSLSYGSFKNMLYKTHCKSQSTSVAIYGHNCLYTENVLFSSFSAISDLALAPVVNVLQIIIAGALFSAWITVSLVSIQRQMPTSIYISNSPPLETPFQ